MLYIVNYNFSTFYSSVFLHIGSRHCISSVNFINALSIINDGHIKGIKSLATNSDFPSPIHSRPQIFLTTNSAGIGKFEFVARFLCPFFQIRIRYHFSNQDTLSFFKSGYAIIFSNQDTL